MTVRRVILPAPPDAHDQKYSGDDGVRALLLDICVCLGQWKGALENYSRLQSAPAGQQLQATAFTTQTVITGTSTGTDVANFVATFVAALTAKGIVSPTVSRTDNQ